MATDRLVWSRGRKHGALRGTVHPRVANRLAWLAICGMAFAAAEARAAPGDSAESSAPLQPTLPAAPASDPAPDGPRPWADGVAEADQAIARELYAAGNREFAESRFAQALAKYREAIRHWDHPAIRYNMAVCLINLDQPVEAHDNLEKSLAYGAAALGSEAHAQGLTYRKLLDAQLGRVAITCPAPGAVVTLDGQYLFTGPGTAERVLLPGGHQVVATKPGLQTVSSTLTLVAGKPVRYEIRPTLEALGPIGPHWKHWKYVAVGGGVLVVAGAGFYLAARGKYQEFDRDFAFRCPFGCSQEMVDKIASLRAERDTAQIQQSVAFTALAVGGAAVITGVIGVLVDQPRLRTGPIPTPVVQAVPGGALVVLGGGF